MNKKSNIILKVAAIVMVLIGLLAMLVAWELLLVSGIHNSTVVVLEMGGVVVCMAGYFLWRRVKALEKDAKRQIQAVQSSQKKIPKNKAARRRLIGSSPSSFSSQAKSF